MTVGAPADRAFVAVGSNIEPGRYVVEALDALLALLPVPAVSTFYRTRAVGVEGQDDYRNGVFVLETNLTPRALKFEVLRPVEARLGRVRTAERFAPRTIDLDIAVFGDWVLDETDLKVPDPEIWQRPFIAAPLLEVAPDLVLPGTDTALVELDVAHQRDGLFPDEPLTGALRMRIRR